jgi:hypothetical protein
LAFVGGLEFSLYGVFEFRVVNVLDGSDDVVEVNLDFLPFPLPVRIWFWHWGYLAQ